MAVGPVYPPKKKLQLKTFAPKGVGIGGGRSTKNPAPPTQKPPKTQNHPTTQMPVMPSEHELRAQANAQAWKSIQQMQSTLPSEGQLMAQYGAQRNAVIPLVQAHRDWLEKAGEYQVGMTNALSTLTQQAAGAGDAQQAGSAALGGAGLGAGAPGTNVSPASAAMPVASYGTSTANYLRSLVPYATAQGIGNIGRIDQAENEARTSLTDTRAKIAAELPGLQSDNYTSSYNAAFQQYKSELATLAAAQKGDLATTKTLSGIADSKERLRISAMNAQTSRDRADSAIRLANIKATEAAKGTGTRTAGDASNLKAGLAKALDAYNDKGGTTGAGRFGTVMKMPAYKDALGRSHAAESHPIAADSPEEVRRLIAVFLKQHPKITEGPNKGQGAWSQQAPIAGLKGYSKKTGQSGDYNRRMKAWGIFKAANAATLHPVSVEKLREMFRYAIPK